MYLGNYGACDAVNTSNDVHAPSARQKLAQQTGLVGLYAKAAPAKPGFRFLISEVPVCWSNIFSYKHYLVTNCKSRMRRVSVNRVPGKAGYVLSYKNTSPLASSVTTSVDYNCCPTMRACSEKGIQNHKNLAKRNNLLPGAN